MEKNDNFYQPIFVAL